MAKVSPSNFSLPRFLWGRLACYFYWTASPGKALRTNIERIPLASGTADCRMAGQGLLVLAQRHLLVLEQHNMLVLMQRKTLAMA